MKTCAKILAAASGLALLASCVVPAPSLRCLVSPMTGELKVDGHPAAKMKIVRHYRSEWYDEEKDDATYTDNQGRFAFSEVWRASAILLVHQPVVHIKVFVEQEGATTTLLQVTKMDYARFGELDPYAPRSGVAKVSREDGCVHLEADIPSSPKQPNQALLPTSTSVTPCANAHVAPAVAAADL